MRSSKKKRVWIKIFLSVSRHFEIFFLLTTSTYIARRKIITEGNRLRSVCMMIWNIEIVHVFIQSVRSKNMNQFSSFSIHLFIQNVFFICQTWFWRPFYMTKKINVSTHTYNMFFTKYPTISIKWLHVTQLYTLGDRKMILSIMHNLYNHKYKTKKIIKT